MPGYADGLSEIDNALAQYGGAPPPAPPKAPVTGQYLIEDEDASPTPGVRFATPAQISNVRPMPAADGGMLTDIGTDRPAYLSELDTIDRALAAAPTTDAGPPTAQPDAPAPTKPTWSDLPADMGNSLIGGMEKAGAALLSLPRSIRDAAARGENWAIAKAYGLTGQLPPGRTEEDLRDDLNKLDDTFASDRADHAMLPSSQDFQKVIEKVDGPIYQPKTVAGEFAQTFGEWIPGAGRNIVTGALLPGIAEEAAGQATKGTGFEPWARVGAGIAGALTGAAVPYAAAPVQKYLEPLTKGGQEAIATRTLGQNVSDLDKTRTALDQPSELVADSAPTTFQKSGDYGLGQLERKQRMDSASAPAYIERDQSQNAARMGALQGIQQSGSPADVASRFRQMRETLDQHAQDRIDALRPAASEANAAIGGFGTADATGYNLRAPMAEARAAAKEHEDALWGLVNQDAGVPANGISQIARDTKNGVSQSATPMSGEEARIFDAAAGYPATQRFGDLKDLRGAITDETAEARKAGKTQSVRRLTILRKAVDDALDHGVENQAALEQIAVQRGMMAPEDTIEAQVQALREKWAQDFAGSTALARGELAGTGTGPVRLSGRATTTIAGRSGTEGQATRGSVRPPGDPRVSQEAPAFTPEDVANYRAATKATRQRAETFDEGAAGRILQPAGRGGYAMPDAAVPSAVVPSGKPTDALAVRQFVAAGGKPDALADATAYSIRSNAKRLDGTLDPNKVHAWLSKNQDALAEMPPEVAAKFRNVADSQAAVDQMVAKHEADRAAFNKTAIARIAGLQHGEDVVKTIGGIFGQKNAVQQMKGLADAASSDPSARDGLRRAVVEYLLGRLTSNASVNASGISQIKGDTFIGFMGKNGAALSQVFKPQEMNTIAAIGNDLDRALRTHQTKGLTSSPGTAQDIGAAKGSILSELGDKVGPAGFAMVSHAAGANVLTSALSFLGAQTIGRMRAAGIASANDLVVKAMLDPALAKRLLAKVPDRPGRTTAQALGDQFVRISRATAAGEFASMSDRRH